MNVYDEMLEILETILTDEQIQRSGTVTLHADMLERINAVVDKAKKQ